MADPVHEVEADDLLLAMASEHVPADVESGEAGGDATATSRDLWGEIEWVKSVTDAATKANEVQAAFDKIMFELPPPEGEDDDDDDQPKKRFRTAADDAAKEEMRRDLEDLNDDVVEEPEDDDDILDWDNISEQEELERAQEVFEGAGEEFQAWIQEGGVSSQAHLSVNQRRIMAELDEMYLGDAAEEVAKDQLPERFHEIADRDKRPNLAPRPLPDGTNWKMSYDAEAVWIVKQLTARGNLLSGSSEASKVFDVSAQDAVKLPVVKATTRALEYFHNDFKEPSYIALHHRDEMAPLLHALWSTRDDSIPNASFAYSTATGERQDPMLFPDFVGFAAKAGATVNPAVDAQFTRRNIGAPTIRKPCSIDLGRLLVAILELDSQCHAIQRGQLMLKRRLDSLAETAESGTAQLFRMDQEVFGMTDFDTPADVTCWQHYLNHCTKQLAPQGAATSVMSHASRIRQLGLDAAFDTYALRPQMYQRNLTHGFKFHSIPAPPTEDIFAWATQEGLKGSHVLSGEEILQLFNFAIAEEVAALPVVCKKVFDLFCSDGLCVITPTRRNVDGERRAVKVSRLLEVNPRHYLECVQNQRSGLVRTKLVVAESLVREQLDIERYFEASATSDNAWAVERSKAIDMLIPRVIDAVTQQVEEAILREAEAAVVRCCSNSLGQLCAMGPYEETTLALPGFNNTVSTWEADWNCLESLPSKRHEIPRVCGVFRGDNDVTVFACVDEHGKLRGSCRWVDFDSHSEAGAEIDRMQRDELVALFKRCSPNVIAVAANTDLANKLVGQMRQFVEKDIQDVFMHTVKVIWAPSVVATTYSWSDAAVNEMPNSDVVLRSAVSVARFTLDPMMELSRLFDPVSKDILRLPLGTHHLVDRNKIFDALSWEMSLWVTACGVDINSLLLRANPSAMLQFLAGFGPRKAYAFVREQQIIGRVKSRNELTETFAADPYLLQNALPSLRIMGENDNPLDSTLIPPTEYEVARTLAQKAVGAPTPTIGLARLMMLDEDARRRLLAECGSNRDFLLAAASLPNVGGRSNMDFILDELIAMGKSYMRRPFRLLSAEHLMKLVTGVHYVPKGDNTPIDTTLVVREGDIVQGIVQGINLSPAGVRITTARGLMAMLLGDDISNEALRQSLQDSVIDQMEMREQRKKNRETGEDKPVKARFEAPPQLARGAAIFGEVVGVNHSRCEIRLKWVPAPEPKAPAPKEEGPSRHDTDRSSQMSVATNDLRNLARINATKLSRHILFRAIGSHAASNLLQGKTIGETLIRPSSDRINEGVVSVRVGDLDGSVMHLKIAEERNSNGSLKYTVTDKRTRRRYEFEDVDHCLQTYVEGVINNIHSIRTHRRFQPNRTEAEASLARQQVETNNKLAYTFVEHASASSAQHFYHVLFRLPGNTKTMRYHLYIDNDRIYLCLKEGKIACKNAEDCAAQLKKYVTMIGRKRNI